MQESPTFKRTFDVTIRAGSGEHIARQVNKGHKVIIAGRLQWREWETAGGDTSHAVDIVANRVVSEDTPVDVPDTRQPVEDDDFPF